MSCFTKDKRKVLFLSLLAAKHFAMQSSAMYCSWHRCVTEQVNERPIEKIKKQTKKNNNMWPSSASMFLTDSNRANTDVFSPHSVALWFYGSWWSHVETTSIHGAVISSCWDQWHAWSRPFSFVPTDPLFSPIQLWWLLSHHCLHPPLAGQWTPVCRPVSHTDLYLVRSPRLVESLLLPISEVAEWLLPLICTLPFFFLSHWIFLSHTFQMWQK